MLVLFKLWPLVVGSVTAAGGKIATIKNGEFVSFGDEAAFDSYKSDYENIRDAIATAKKISRRLYNKNDTFIINYNNFELLKIKNGRQNEKLTNAIVLYFAAQYKIK